MTNFLVLNIFSKLGTCEDGFYLTMIFDLCTFKRNQILAEEKTRRKMNSVGAVEIYATKIYNNLFLLIKT